MPSSDGRGPRLADHPLPRIIDREGAVDLAALAHGTCLTGGAASLVGLSVLVAPRAQLLAAAALVELDGRARRLTILPPDFAADHLHAVIEDAEVDAVITDTPERFAGTQATIIAISPEIAPVRDTPERAFDTEWALLTSGTSGRPKIVVHTLAGLTGAIGAPVSASAATWATFYDIRRYGGLQIFFRAVLGGSMLVLSSEGEAIGDQLHRLGEAGVTHISGTPSHWRRVLMSAENCALAPRYVRLSGEIADQIVLDGLRAVYPDASIGHAYASTEAGVGFAVDDGLEGFPAVVVDSAAGGVEMKVEDGTLRIKSRRTALRYLGAAAPPLTDADGFVDTGDVVERRGDRYVFLGRRGGIINVGGLKVNPEEVEAAIRAHDQVRLCLVQGRKNPLIGAIVVADIVLRDPDAMNDVAHCEALKNEILEMCRARLDRHKVPAILRFVPALALTPGGKLSRVPAAAHA